MVKAVLLSVRHLCSRPILLFVEGNVEVLDMGRNIFAFQFSDKEDYLKVLRGRPWAIQTHLLNLQLWDDDLLLKEVVFNICPFWVQFQGLTFSFMSLENAIRLGSAIGRVVMAENPVQDGKVIRNFLRLRVLVDISKPLAIGFWVPRNMKDDIWSEVRYERIPSFCYRCGIIGHDKKLCTLNVSSDDDEDCEFGSWLKASPPKPMMELIELVDSEWCERRETPRDGARELHARGAKNTTLQDCQKSESMQQGGNIGLGLSNKSTVEPLTAENVLWSNTVLAAGSAIGFVVYTGPETRAVMNTSHPETKMGLLDIEINRLAKVSYFI